MSNRAACVANSISRAALLRETRLIAHRILDAPSASCGLPFRIGGGIDDVGAEDVGGDAGHAGDDAQMLGWDARPANDGGVMAIDRFRQF